GRRPARASPRGRPRPPPEGRPGRRNRGRRRVHVLPRRLAARGPRSRRRASARLCCGRDRRFPLRGATIPSDRGRGRRDTPPLTRILLDCDPGHDDAIALLLALASPELELLRVTTVAGKQTLAKTTAH